MNIDEKDALARRGNMSKEASAARMKACRKISGLSQDLLARTLGLKKTTISSVERAQSYPSRDMMRYFFRAHRIDFNFMISGDWAGLPGETQDTLFHVLAELKNGEDPVSSSS